MSKEHYHDPSIEIINGTLMDQVTMKLAPMNLDEVERMVSLVTTEYENKGQSVPEDVNKAINETESEKISETFKLIQQMPENDFLRILDYLIIKKDHLSRRR